MAKAIQEMCLGPHTGVRQNSARSFQVIGRYNIIVLTMDDQDRSTWFDAVRSVRPRQSPGIGKDRRRCGFAAKTSLKGNHRALAEADNGKVPAFKSESAQFRIQEPVKHRLRCLRAQLNFAG